MRHDIVLFNKAEGGRNPVHTQGGRHPDPLWLIHRHGAWRHRQLNVDDRHRASAVLLALAALAAMGSLAKPTLAAAAPLLAGAALLPHWRVLRFMTEKRGLWFGLRAAPTLWLYLAYSTAAGVVGTVMFATDELS